MKKGNPMIIRRINSFYLRSTFLLLLIKTSFLFGQENPVHIKLNKVVNYVKEKYNDSRSKVNVIFTNDHLSRSQYYILLNDKWLCVSYNYGKLEDEFIGDGTTIKQLNFIKSTHYREIHHTCILNNCNGCTLVNTYRLKVRPQIKVVKS